MEVMVSKKEMQKLQAVLDNGGTLPGKKAAKLAKVADSGTLGTDGKVRDTRGKVTGDFSGRTRKRTNEHGV
jgi:hypothetical protein